MAIGDVVEEEFLMMYWDCVACDTTGIRGDVYSCPNCDFDRSAHDSDSEEIHFYLPEVDEVITDAEGIAAAKAGPDWECEFCGDWVSATLSTCPGCTGGSRDGAARHETREVEGKGEEFKRSHKSPLPPSADSVLGATKNRTPQPRIGGPSWVVGGVIGALLLMSIWALHPKEVRGVVSGHSWMREVATEVFQVGIPQNGWDYPRDAYEVASERKFHHNEKVLSHYRTDPVYSTRQVAVGTEPVYSYRTVFAGVETYYVTERYQSGSKPTYSYRTQSLGNGRAKRVKYQSGSTPVYSTRQVKRTRNKTKQERYQSGTKTIYRSERYQSGTKQVPIYRNEPRYQPYYHYKVDRWVASSPLRSQGQDVNPQWPLDPDRDPKEFRTRDRRAWYKLHLTETSHAEDQEPRSFQMELSEPTWRSWKDGEPVILEITATGSLRSFRRPGEEKK